MTATVTEMAANMTLKHKPQPQVIKSFSDAVFADLKQHINEVRRLFDWPGIEYHDKGEKEDQLFNRWCWHNLPLLRKLHNSPELIKMASDLAGMQLQPSYAFLSMYGPEGICPKHVDRPQCQFTIDLCISQDAPWPIYVEEKPYILEEGQALFYSGTGQEHFRKAMKEDSKATYCNLAFFHFVPVEWQGTL